ncbi:MAG TPA: galactokinase [Candidatus Limnocylindrales bacterium]|nr:galactokinase [Candidatus Limnocylindrales bacterium]
MRGPGRVNLIGEHTDYNEGFVLPVAIDRWIMMALVPTDDRVVELTLLADGTTSRFELDALPRPGRGSIDYVAGVAWSLSESGWPVRGFRAVLASNLPMSAGLSSSAALELASAWALLDADRRPDTDQDRMELARIAQRAENDFVGVRCGLMDQFASSLGRPGAAMLLDCRSLDYRAVTLPLEEHALVVCDSASPRRLAASQYNARREQCERATRLIRSRRPSVKSLRDVDSATLAESADLLDDETMRRAQHVVSENQRVLDCVDALERGDMEAVGRLFAASHASLRDLYEVSSPELDALVEAATAAPGGVAARMTGAGFGGCTINVVERNRVDDFAESVTLSYRRATGLTGRVMVVNPSAGAGVVE